MTSYEPRKRSTQSEDPILAAGPDTRKKPRKANAGLNACKQASNLHVDRPQSITGGMDQTVRRSSRSTKGNGGQIAQLQNIERVQTEQSSASKLSHSSQLEMATAEELLNPMAPMKLKPRIKTSAGARAAGGPGHELVCDVLPPYGSKC